MYVDTQEDLNWPKTLRMWCVQEGFPLAFTWRSTSGSTPVINPFCAARLPSVSGGGLRQHKKMHASQKPFLCEVCSKNFTAARSVVVHTGHKPFVCNICGKAFLLMLSGRCSCQKLPITALVCALYVLHNLCLNLCWCVHYLLVVCYICHTLHLNVHACSIVCVVQHLPS